MANGTYVIEVTGLTKVFFAPATLKILCKGRMRGELVYALRDVSFRCKAGEILGVIGPNGAGKTTLLRLLGGLLWPTTGSVRVFGHEVEKAPASFRSQVAYLGTDERSFSLRLTGRQNLHFFATLYGWEGEERKRVVEERLADMGLMEAADRPFGAYSTGMRSRLAFARGLLGSASLLLCDEPMRGIDPWAKKTFRDIFARLLAQGKTLLLATHDLDDLRLMCEQTLVLKGGELVGIRPVSDIEGLVNA